MIDIVLLAGQSNMVGWKNSVEDIPPRWRGQVTNSHIWQDGAWVPLKAEGGYQKKGFGPELSFANGFQAAVECPIGLIKVAQNASYLSREWDPAREDGLLDQLITQTRAAMATGPCRLRGLLWMQGEADAINADDAEAYKARFAALITKLRVRLGCPDLPVVAGLIDAPLDQCPHTETVREAIGTVNVDAVETVDCRGLSKRADTLHFDPRGLSKLGNMFAASLSKMWDTASEPLVRQWIWNSDQYQAWFEGPDALARDAVVTFPHAVTDSGFDEVGFGQSFFSKSGIAAVHILSNKSDWFQNDEIFEVTKAIRTYLSDAVQVVAYGASMGAHGALLTSGALEADKIIAIAPQYSIDRKTVPWEVRWKKAAKFIGTFRHDMESAVSKDALKFVFYDPLSEDRRQIELFEMDDSWKRVTFPMASHQILQFLQETGSLSMLMKDFFGDGPHIFDLMAHARANRTTSRLYWMTRAAKTAARRPDIAETALARAIDIGIPQRKRRIIREQIDQSRLDKVAG